MIILDTNVVSEMVKEKPSPQVIRWLNEQFQHTLYITANIVGEALVGLELMPIGRKRQELSHKYAKLFDQVMPERVLSFDYKAARVFALISARSLKAGKNLKTHDLQIASIALSQGFAVATRDTNHFRHEGLTVINPWTD